MPNASTTQQVSSLDTTGSPIGLAYGYVWATGKRIWYTTVQNTGNENLDFTRVGHWALGEGEWDGNQEMWINDNLVWNGGPGTAPITRYAFASGGVGSYAAGQALFNFHRGADAVIGSGLTPTSTGPDQGVDSFCANYPAGVQVTTLNRMAYYGLMIKQPVIDGTGKQSDPSQWTDIAPIGLWRARRTRLFDDNGNQTGYAFTTNPAWHIVDALLLRKIKPDYNIDLVNGPTPLTAAEAARFDWGSITEAALYFDQQLANGRRRFTGNYSFTAAATLNAILEQMLLCCRSHMHEYAGKIYLICDQPRASTFIVSRNFTEKLEASDQQLHTSPNRFVGKFRDLLVPACAQIASIGGAGSLVNVTTVEGHPCQEGDNIIIGGEGVPYDGYWSVVYVPSLTAAQVAAGVQVYTMTLQGKGSNYAVPGPAGGYIGLIYSRFKERTPWFDHQRNQYSRGALGVGISRQRKKIAQTQDLAVLTYDQAARIMMYERDRALGPDAIPYVTPAALTCTMPLFAEDVNGVLVLSQKFEDCITLDSTASVPYAGQYQILKRVIRPCAAPSTGDEGTMVRKASSESGSITLTLWPYNPTGYYDSSSNTEAGWVDVPGSDPGNESAYTGGSTGSGGTGSGGSFAFISGSLPSGSSFTLPSIGYPAANVLAWASPQGYLLPSAPLTILLSDGVGDGPMTSIKLCSVTALTTALQYTDAGVNAIGTRVAHVWGGDVNYAALAWSTGTVVTVGSMTYVELTLANGEVICFGQGIVADGGSFALPTGFTTSQMFAWCGPYDNQGSTPPTFGTGFVGNQIPAQGWTNWIDGTPPTTVHMQYMGATPLGGSSSTWSGRAQVLVFAWKNNSGACAVSPVTGGSWMTVDDTSSSVMGVGLVRLSHGQTLPVPAVAASGTMLQSILSPRSAASPPANAGVFGVSACYLDASNTLHMVWGDPVVTQPSSGSPFENVGSTTWNGDAMVFAIFWGAQAGSGSGTPSIAITPSTASVAASTGYQQFSSLVTGESNANVTWSVDGIAGGNSTVGTIDSTGVYTAPATAGIHTVTATSVASSSLTASATVTVTA